MKGLWLFLILLLPGATWGATLSGRLVDGDRVVKDMQVFVCGELNPKGPVLASARTDGEGVYRLELPPGQYAVFARDEVGKRFAFSGRNPITISADDQWVGLQVVPVTEARRLPYDDEYSAGLEGQVLFAGEPVSGAVVYLYLDAGDGLKGQGYRMSPVTDADGRFFFDGLPESDYFLLARQRLNGQSVGPVQAGDRIGYYPGNPLLLKGGESMEVSLPLVEKLESVASAETFGEVTETRISGRIVDPEGQPVAGVHVFAYVDRVIGHQRPEALSSPTSADGRFDLYLPRGGVYYLGARELYGDSPMPGELFGMYEKTADHGFNIADGADETGMKITVEPIRLD